MSGGRKDSVCLPGDLTEAVCADVGPNGLSAYAAEGLMPVSDTLGSAITMAGA